MKILKRHDVMVMVCLLAVAALLYFYYYRPADNGSVVEIDYDGNRVAEVDFSQLAENEEKTFEINGVTIKVDREGAYFAESICKGQVCVKSGRVNKAGQTVVCLPQRVSIHIIGGSRYDGITG